MEDFSYIVEEYVTPAGKIPFREWLHSLRDIRARAKIRVRLNRIRLGNFGDARPVGDGVYELRINYGPGYRVYYARTGRYVILLLCGGNKSSQKRDIAKAKAYFADYKQRQK